MILKKAKWDILFIIISAGFLIFLSQIGRMDLLTKLPFVTIYTAYVIGRIVGSKTLKTTNEK